MKQSLVTVGSWSLAGAAILEIDTGLLSVRLLV